jgi:hypothetical protein
VSLVKTEPSQIIIEDRPDAFRGRNGGLTRHETTIRLPFLSDPSPQCFCGFEQRKVFKKFPRATRRRVARPESVGSDKRHQTSFACRPGLDSQPRRRGINGLTIQFYEVKKWQPSDYYIQRFANLEQARRR